MPSQILATTWPLMPNPARQEAELWYERCLLSTREHAGFYLLSRFYCAYTRKSFPRSVARHSVPWVAVFQCRVAIQLDSLQARRTPRSGVPHYVARESFPGGGRFSISRSLLNPTSCFWRCNLRSEKPQPGVRDLECHACEFVVPDARLVSYRSWDSRPDSVHRPEQARS